MSVTIIDVSDSFTSRAFADCSTGWNRFKPADNLSATFAGAGIMTP